MTTKHRRPHYKSVQGEGTFALFISNGNRPQRVRAAAAIAAAGLLTLMGATAPTAMADVTQIDCAVTPKV